MWVFLFVRQLRSQPLLPLNDPFFKQMFAHRTWRALRVVAPSARATDELHNEGVAHENSDVNVRAISRFGGSSPCIVDGGAS